MIRADAASIDWGHPRKEWTVTIHAGAEVIKRRAGKRLPHDAPDDELRAAALNTAHDDGYEVAPDSVAIQR